MRIHPLMAGAAVSVMVLSAVGVAAITGVLPGSLAGKQEQAAVVPCTTCGVVVKVREVEVKGKATGVGAVAGGVAGAVVGRELSDRNDVATVLGAAGGALAGHQIERHARTTKRYQVEVRMEDGSTRTVRFNAAPHWKAGDAVRVESGTLVPAGASTRG